MSVLDQIDAYVDPYDVDYSGMKLAPTSTVRGWERMPLILPN